MKYSVKNFRVFGDDGVTLDLAPITILTGCNSSGKSSIAKSLLLLDSYFTNGRIDFTKRPYSLLGDFDKVLNRNSKDGMITIEYSTYSIAYDGEITVRLKFGRDEKDDLHNAFLQEICFLDSDGYIIYQSLCGKDGYYMDRACMEGLKERFFNFLSRSYQTKNERKFELPLLDELYAFSWLKVSPQLRDAINRIPSRTVIKDARELQSLYVLNIFGWLNDCTCENIENAIYSHVDPKSVSPEVSTGIKMLVKDFRMSQCDTFIEYFSKKESRRVFYNENYKNIELLFSSERESATPRLCTHFDIRSFGNLPTPFKIRDNVRNKLMAEGLTQSEIELRWWNVHCCTFERVYSLLMILERLAYTESFISYTRHVPNDYFVEDSSYILNAFNLYLNQILEEGTTPNFKGVSYVTSSRANVQRMYTLEESNDFALLLRQYFETKRKFKPQGKPYYSESSDIEEDDMNDTSMELEHWLQPDTPLAPVVHTPPQVGAEEYNEPNTFINKWLNQFGIAHHISIKKAEEGGVYIYLYSDENDQEGELLADKGYGVTQLISILLQIEIAIMNSNSKWIRPDFYGDNPKVGRHSQLIVIEEPEIHLHPSYQSLLADMFLEAYQKYNIHFIIETHSEYLIRRTQVITSEQRYESLEELNEKNPFRVYYVTKESQLYDMRYRTNGLFAEKFGEGFMDEASKMHMMLLKNDRRQ